MKMRKHKGKVHPSPSPSSSNKDNNNNTLSILNLLPTAILAIASLLSLEDREVLAYMVTRSMKPTTVKKNSKKIIINNTTHKPPCFDCECFDCYTCYWFKWDSSPNRELIHQAIEAFEDHLSHNEEQTNKKNSKQHIKNKRLKSTGVFLPDDFVVHVSPVNADVEPENTDVVEEMVDEVVAVEEVELKTTVMVQGTAVNGGGGGHKGLARKVLPDVLGLFNSRLWNLWSPNV